MPETSLVFISNILYSKSLTALQSKVIADGRSQRNFNNGFRRNGDPFHMRSKIAILSWVGPLEMPADCRSINLPLGSNQGVLHHSLAIYRGRPYRGSSTALPFRYTDPGSIALQRLYTTAHEFHMKSLSSYLRRCDTIFNSLINCKLYYSKCVIIIKNSFKDSNRSIKI